MTATLTDLIVPAPLWRRLAAATYDGFLLLAVWVCTIALLVTVGNASGHPPPVGLTRAAVLIAGFFFCGWFWIKGGQTPGMIAWRLQVRRQDGRELRLPIALLRYGAAWLSWLPVGLGVLWCGIDRRGRAWHDMIAGTEVVQLPPRSRRMDVTAGDS